MIIVRIMKLWNLVSRISITKFLLSRKSVSCARSIADLRCHRSHCARSAVAKGALFLTRPVLFHYIERRDALEASASELFEVVASGKGRIDVNQRFALKDAADAHKALEARATSGSTILTL